MCFQLYRSQKEWQKKMQLCPGVAKVSDGDLPRSQSQTVLILKKAFGRPPYFKSFGFIFLNHSLELKELQAYLSPSLCLGTALAMDFFLIPLI